MPTPNIDISGVYKAGLDDLLGKLATYQNDNSKSGRTKYAQTMRDLATFESYINREKDNLSNFEELQQKINKLHEEELQLLEDKYKQGKLTFEQMMQLTEHLERQKKLEEEKKKAARENFDKYVKGIDTVVDGIKQIGAGINSLIEPWAKIDQAAANYAKSIGSSVAGMKYMRDITLRNVAQNRIGIKLGYSADELIKLQEGYLKSVGRNILVSNKGQENLAAMSRVLGEQEASQMAARLENFGLSITDASKTSARMFGDATKAGLSMEKYTKNFTENLSIAQNYTFRNGLKGLESMAKKATEMRIDMQQVAALAEKVSTVEGSIDVASKLQVLGGSFSALADPLGMLNEGLNDMEGLNDRFIAMIKGMGTVVDGEVQVSSYNKRRIKAAAEAMGMSYDKVMESVNNGTRREEIERQLRAAGNPNINDNLAELIKNAGVIENGKAGVRDENGNFVELKDVNETMANALIAQTRTEADNIVDIAANLRSVKDIMEGFNKQKDTVQAKMFGWLGEGVKGIVGALGTLNGLLGTLIVSKAAWGAFKGGISFWDNMSGILGKGGGIGLAGKGGGVTPGTGGGAGMFAGGKIVNWFKPSAVSKTASKAVRGNLMGKWKYLTSGAKMSTKLNHAGQLIKGSGGRIMGPLAFAASAFGRYMSDKDDTRMSGGKKAGRAVGAGLGSGAGAILGGILAGPLGAAIGGYAGEVLGTWIGGGFANQKRRNRVFEELRGGLSGKNQEIFKSMNGDYSVKNMRAINSALYDGEISNRLRKKLLRRGDTSLLEAIDKKSEQEDRENTNKELAKKPHHYDKAVFYIQNGVFANNLNPDKIFESMDMSKTGNPPVSPVKGSLFASNMESSLGNKKISLDISGTLTLRDMNGNKFDINDLGKKLANNPDFNNMIADAVSRVFNKTNNGTEVKTSLGNYSPMIWAPVKS